jgi:LacI family transcriptional regulator
MQIDASTEGSQMKRVPVNILMKETGLSRATIDRVLNGRGNVHDKTRKVVEKTFSRLSEMDDQSAASAGADVVLRLGRGLMGQVRKSNDMLGQGAATLHDMHQEDDTHIHSLVRELCQDISRPLIITAKNSENLQAELRQAHLRGKRIVTFVSDLAHDTRDAFVGIDNRMAGQTAAFVLGNFFNDSEAKVGVVLGDYSFRAHEDREIGFRSCLRANFPNVQVADVAKADDSPERTRDAVSKLLADHPELDGIYNVGGGNAGVVEAIKESGRNFRVVAHEVNHITAPLIRDGYIQYVIAQDATELLRRALDVASRPAEGISKEMNFINFGVYTKFNLPSSFYLP